MLVATSVAAVVMRLAMLKPIFGRVKAVAGSEGSATLQQSFPLIFDCLFGIESGCLVSKQKKACILVGRLRACMLKLSQHVVTYWQIPISLTSQ